MYILCPRCKSKNVKVIETKIRVRKHKCLECGYEFEIQTSKEEENNFH
jgi:transposase-like protein